MNQKDNLRYNCVKIYRKVLLLFSQKTSSPRIVFLLGIGQSGYNFRFVSENTPESVAVVSALPYQKLARDKITELSIKAVVDVLHTFPADKQLVLVAESQAAPVAVYAALKHADLFEQVILLSPLGLNPDRFGTTPLEMRKQLLLRTNAFWRHKNQSLLEKANRRTLIEIGKLSARQFYRLRADLSFAGGQNIVTETKLLAEKIPVIIFTDENDSLFPYAEIKQAMSGSKIALHKTTTGSHLNRASKKGMQELRDALEQNGIVI